MPITQDRMITLINAALDFVTAFDECKKEIADLLKTDSTNPTLRHFRIFISDIERLRHPVDSRLTIAYEAAHFRQRARYNNYQRQRQQARATPSAPRQPNQFSSGAPPTSPIANPRLLHTRIPGAVTPASTARFSATSRPSTPRRDQPVSEEEIERGLRLQESLTEPPAITDDPELDDVDPISPSDIDQEPQP